MTWIGIDPGVTGGIVCLTDDGAPLWFQRTPVMPGSGRTEFDLRGMSQLILDTCTPGQGLPRCAIEKVHAMPRDGRVGAFSFGKGYGIWLGLLTAHAVSYQEVLPQRWQARMLAGLPRGPHTKRSALQRCQTLFPAINLTLKRDHGIADAALIAEYYRQTSTPS